MLRSNAHGRQRGERVLFLGLSGVFVIGVLTLALTIRRSEPSPARYLVDYGDVKRNSSLQSSTLPASIADTACEEPLLVNLAWLKSLESLQGGAHQCEGYERVCIDQGVLVLHDEKYSPANPVAADLPSFDVSDLMTTWVGKGGNIGDVYEKGRMMYPPLVFRLAVPGDRVPNGFSTCTLPVLLFKSFESNYHEVLMAVLGQVFHWHQQSAVDSGVTFVVGTPGGRPLLGFWQNLLRPFSKRQVVSLAEIGAGRPLSSAGGATSDGSPSRCFQRVIACKIEDWKVSWPARILEAGHHVKAWYREAGQLPPNPVKYAGLLSNAVYAAEHRVKVLIVTRPGPVRNLLGASYLVEACNADTSGPWTCGLLAMGVDFTRDLAAADEADILVVVHGSAASNLVFMREGAALLELRPMGFSGYADGQWADAFFPRIAEQLRHKIRYFAVNVEDPQLSRPGPWEAASRGDPHMWVRDRHVQLPWPTLRDMLQLIISVRGDTAVYTSLVKRGVHVMDLVEGGTLRRAASRVERLALACLRESRAAGERAVYEARRSLTKAVQGDETEARAAADGAWAGMGQCGQAAAEADRLLQQAARDEEFVDALVERSIQEGQALVERTKQTLDALLSQNVSFAPPLGPPALRL